MHKGGFFVFVFLYFFFSHSFGSVESYRNSLFIFLSDKDGSLDPYAKSGIYDYVSTRITGDIGSLYPYSIDVSSRSASDLSSIFSNHESNSVFAKALEYCKGDVVYVNVSQKGTYTLETVNAVGMPLVLLFSGVWGEGEHSVSLANYTLTPGSYLVLRRGSEILSWKLFR